jgi:hypothetical protein
MTGQAKFGVGTYIWKSIIASALGNFVGAAILIIPLVYMHGSDSQNPYNIDTQALPGSQSPSGTYIGNNGIRNTNDVEKAVV